MGKNLNVPYRSQSDIDAQFASTDCGAACVAMLLEGFGQTVKIDDIFITTGKSKNEFLSRQNLINAAGKFNLKLRRFNIGSQKFLKSSIDQNKPLIALVNYGAWSKPGSGVPTQSTFSSAHFVVVSGYDGDDVFINDPLWRGAQREQGHNKKMTYAQFASAWGTAHTFPGNPDFAGLIPTEIMPEQEQHVVPQVTEAEINRILAWAFMNNQNVTATELAERLVADVFLRFMGTWGTRVVDHVLQPNDNLGLLALKYYGDPLKWKVITLFNNLPPINAFENRTSIKIPEPTQM